MKAEQRKELETNTLADKMGHVMQRVRTSPRRTFFFYFIIIAVVVGGAWIGWNYYKSYRRGAAEQALLLYDGSEPHIRELAAKDRDSKIGKAALFQIAWFLYWDNGVKLLATDPRAALMSLEESKKYFEILETECKDDPIYLPQALLGQAVIEESLAVQSFEHLKNAKKFYDQIVDKHKDSAEAKFAQRQLEMFTKNKKADLEDTYELLRRLLNIPMAPQIQPGGNQNLFPPPKGK